MIHFSLHVILSREDGEGSGWGAMATPGFLALCGAQNDNE